MRVGPRSARVPTSAPGLWIDSKVLGDIIRAIGWAFLPLLALPVVYLVLPGSLRGVSRALIRLIDTVTHAYGRLVMLALPLMVVVVASSVFALSVFGTATVAWLESSLYLQAIVITLGAAPTLLAGEHVRVDVFHERMGELARARVDLVGYYLLLAPVCLIILWNSQSFVGFAWATFEGSTESDGIRGVWLLKTLIPVFCVTLLMQGLAIALRAAMALNGERRPDRPAGIRPLFEVPGREVQ